ncbi:Methyltransferase domain-containing protein [Nitrosomonas cryotolerans]|uniref:Methyltransferase domain-containing protein n=1 Tax=Nitrosomonas cryotolerans ATCC 49181 TaxID=1131553 RepID=A0A1N6IVX1_9PROT|nr:class I SAM-dependent methyltransferase [Nitrosomonas cryotolerans]SFP90399.1 Methyltransferase domain-containing protein [Nitrosomonas cryotolerans]SIO36158.1 Methyltransferase domain-containing protein [Nitrosomonas cryotolerans ATCC 49181]
MDIRTQACFTLSKKLMRPPTERTVNYDAYGDWRNDSLSKSWAAFSDSNITGKDVLDFGSGDGPMSLFLAQEKYPKKIVGVDINNIAIERAKKALTRAVLPDSVDVEFLLGSTDQLPVSDQSFDTLLAFDCLEHVMSPQLILRDWYRTLRPGGRCLIEWFPYKGPWGPHMEALIPVPWAHVIFGERAMFRTAEKIYDLPEFVPRHWDLDEQGNKKSNKWRAWSSFEEQAYINKLDIPTFQTLAHNVGFQIARHELHSFTGSRVRQKIGRMLMNTPFIGEYFVSYIIIELLRPKEDKN